MTNPDPHRSHQPDRTADVTQPRARDGAAADGTISDRAAGMFVNSEAALGGADAVQKTSYVVGHGTEPSARSDGEPTAVRSGAGPNYVAWGIGVVAVLVGLVYLFGLVT